MRLIKVELDKKKLLAIPESEATFFLSLGHICNEINAATKLLYWSGNLKPEGEADEHGQFALSLYLTRVLAGHLNEAWEFLRKDYFSPSDSSTTPLAKEYAPLLDGEAAAEMDVLKSYFGPANNLCRQIRNAIAFHFSAADIAGLLPLVQGKLIAYLERDVAPNNLFHCSELLVSEALVKIMNSSSRNLTYDALCDELFRVAARFVRVSDGLMDVVIKKYDLRVDNSPPQEVRFENIRPFKSIDIPWFSDTSLDTGDSK